MSIRTSLAFGILSVMLAGCTAQYTSHIAGETLGVFKLKEKHFVDRGSQWTLHRSTSIYLSAPEIFNQYQLDHHLPTIRAQMHQSFIDAFSRAYPHLTTNSAYWRLEEAIDLAREAKAQVLVVPSLQLMVNSLDTLNDYEAEQLGDPMSSYPMDTAVIKVSLYDVATGNLIDVVSLDSRATLYKSRRYSLSRLMDRAAMNFIQTLSGRAIAPFG